MSNTRSAKRRSQQAKAKTKPRPLSCTMFGGENGEQYNALYSALSHAAEKKGFDHEYKEYELLENCDEFKIYERLLSLPRTSLVCNLIESLQSHGFEIKYTGCTSFWDKEPFKKTPATGENNGSW